MTEEKREKTAAVLLSLFIVSMQDPQLSALFSKDMIKLATKFWLVEDLDLFCPGGLPVVTKGELAQEEKRTRNVVRGTWLALGN